MYQLTVGQGSGTSVPARQNFPRGHMFAFPSCVGVTVFAPDKQKYPALHFTVGVPIPGENEELRKGRL